MSALPILILLFGLMYFLLIRPQKAKAQAQQRRLNTVEVGDEILTVGGIYGIVQELEPQEEGGDLVVEIADGIHVRIARKALATVIKPEEEDDEEDDADEDAEGAEDAEESDADDDEDVVDGDAELLEDAPELPDAGVAEVNGEQDSVNPGAAGEQAPPAHS